MINELKFEKEKLLSENIMLKNNIDSLKVDIDFLINFQQYFEPEKRFVSENTLRHKKSSFGSTISKDDDKEFYKIRRSIIVRIHLSREVLKKEKKNLKKK
jgi:hypothetical protein